VQTTKATAIERSDDPAPANDNALARSWAPEVYAQGQWCGNAIRFATRAEAERYASDLLMRWTVPNDARAVQSTDPVNYALDRNGGLVDVREVAS
jgi:hypothetical protein